VFVFVGKANINPSKFTHPFGKNESATIILKSGLFFKKFLIISSFSSLSKEHVE
jgi:hypothetical protein